jgi:hypothetical protein
MNWNWDAFLGNIGWILACVQAPFTLYVVFFKLIPKLRDRA